METLNLRPVPAGNTPSEITIAALLYPFRHRWRLVITTLLVAWGIGLAVIFIPARKYRASIVLAAVPSASNLSLPGGLGLSALLNNGQLGGLQSTPYFITRLLLLRSVIMSVSMAPVVGSKELVIERLARKPLEDIRPLDIEKLMRKRLNTEVDKQTGLITFSVVDSDSALARQVATQILAAASKTYIDVVRAQARGERIAQEARVDSAQRQLHRAEQDLLTFMSTNRSYTTYSIATIERQRIERRLSNAQSIYSRAIADREGAIARELEATPAVVVVDPIPDRLLPEPRHGLLKMLLSTVLGFMVAGGIMLVLGDFAPGRRSDDLLGHEQQGDPSAFPARAH